MMDRGNYFFSKVLDIYSFWLSQKSLQSKGCHFQFLRFLIPLGLLNRQVLKNGGTIGIEEV